MGSSKKATVGYHYRILKHVGLCKGPIDAFIEYRGGNKTAWKGVLRSVPEITGDYLIASGLYDDWEITTNGTITIDAPGLWGGEKDQGGISGDMDVMLGGSHQMPNAYLLANLGEQIPGWRGIATLVFKGGRYGAINPYPPGGSSKVRKILAGWDNDECWYPERACVWPPGELPLPTGLICSLDNNPTTILKFSGHPNYQRLNWERDYEDTVPEDGNTSSVANALKGPFSPNDALVFLVLPSIPPMQGGLWRFQMKSGDDNEYSHQIQISKPDGSIQSLFAGTYPTRAEADAAWVGMTQSIYGFSEYKMWYGVRPWHTNIYDEAGFANIRVYKVDRESDCVDVYPDGPDMNPAHILYYSRTNSEMGREPVENFNAASLRAAANWFFDHGVGLSTKRDPASESPVEFENRIARVAGCAFTRSLADGKWYIDIANGEYDIDDLPILTDDDILDFTEQPSTLDNAINSVSVKYFDVERKESVTTQPAQAMGLITAFGTIHQTYDFPEISNSKLALLVAQRELLATATPTRAFELATNRTPYTWRANQYFRLQAPKRGIADMVCIVGEIQTGTLRSGAIKLKAVQDVYSLPETVYIQQETGVDTRPGQTPVALTVQRAIEVPYIDVVAALSASELGVLDVDAGFLVGLGVHYGSNLDFTMLVAPDGDSVYLEVGSSDFCPSALVVEEADDKTETEFTLADPIDLHQVEIGMAVLWDDEICRVDDIDVDAGTISLGRGCADTVPALHAADSRLWFYQADAAVDETEYTAGESIDVKLLTNTGSQQLPLGSATLMSLTFDQRQSRPYPPANLKLNGTPYLATVSGALTVTWAHRDRLSQADQLIDTTVASIGPEPSTRYTLQFFDDADALIIGRSDIDGTSAGVVLNPGLPPVVNVDAEVVWADNTITHADDTHQVCGMVGCDTVKTKIIVSPTGRGQIRYSGNGGASWSGNRLTASDGGSSGRSLTSLKYDTVNARWFACTYNSSNGQMRSSSDNFVTLESGSQAPGYIRDYHYDSTGRRYNGENGGSYYIVRRRPLTSNGIEASTPTMSGSPVPSGSITNLVFKINDYLYFPCNGRAFITNESLIALTLTAVDSVPDGRIGACSGSDAFYFKSSTSDTVTWVNPVGLPPFDPDVTVDFGEAVTGFQVSYGDGQYIVTARRTSDPTQLLVMRAPVGDYSTWYGPSVVQLNHTQDDTSSYRRQVAYWGFGMWVVAYRTFRPVPNDTLRHLVVEKFVLAEPVDITMKLWAVSDNGESLQHHEHTFTYTAPGGPSSITAEDYVP